MRVCPLCVLINKKEPISEIPLWCAPHVSLSLSQINFQRLFGGGRVIDDTITPGLSSRFTGKQITCSGMQIWNNMKRCDECIQKIIDGGATVTPLRVEQRAQSSE